MSTTQETDKTKQLKQQEFREKYNDKKNHNGLSKTNHFIFSIASLSAADNPKQCGCEIPKKYKVTVEVVAFFEHIIFWSRIGRLWSVRGSLDA